MKTIQLTDEQWAALQQGEDVVIKAPKKKLSPEGGEWYVNASGTVCSGDSSYNFRLFGMERQTRQEAEALRDELRERNIIAALATEMDRGKWKADWSDKKQRKYSLYFDHDRNVWISEASLCCRTPGVPHMSEQTCEILLEALNNRKVERIER